MSIPVELVSNIVASCFGIVVNTKWVNIYLKKRDNEIKLRNSKYFPKKRAIGTIKDEVEAFIGSLKQQIEQYHFFENNVFNYDETKICTKSDGTMKVGAKFRSNNNDISLKYSSLATLLTFISPNGKCFFSIYILKVGNLESNKLEKLKPYYPNERYYVRGSIRRYFCNSKSGNLTNELFIIVLKFVEH